jgi:hypothetical protein
MRERIVVIVILIISISILIFSNFGKNQAVVYDCRDAHWHPDYPVEVKKECQRIMREELEKQREDERDRKLLRT